ncbi:hypothetical protein SOPP22_09395 [Shewanella sp. OPT22]|nr:hypothetical protein SOPP22_09395 [Shewanella sp. OPT22]
MNHTIIPEHKASIFKGYRFEFEINDHNIVAWGSAWTGREIVSIDDRVVSDLYSYKRKAIHHFDINDTAYEIEFNMVNILQGLLHCTLIEDGTHVATQKQLPNFGKKRVLGWKGIGVCFLLGLVIGLAGSYAIDVLFIQ